MRIKINENALCLRIKIKDEYKNGVVINDVLTQLSHLPESTMFSIYESNKNYRHIFEVYTEEQMIQKTLDKDVDSKTKNKRSIPKKL
jgi:hypothetical protein